MVGTRAQSTVIGFVLMFGIVVLLLLMLQTSAVPAWNQAVEFSHNERVHEEMERLRDDIFRTAATGSTGSETISLGTQYPVRPFLFNPPDPTGRFATRDPTPVTVANATAAGETGDYWNGSTRTYTDRHLVYEPFYNEYEAAPTTVLENSVLYNDHGERSLPATQESLISGRRINIVTLNGSLSRQGRSSTDVELQALSAPEQVTTVRSDGPLVITVETGLDQAEWEDLLADERVAAGGHVRNVSVTQGDPLNTLVLTMETNQTYDLRMAQVGVGTQLSEPPATYLTTDSDAELTVPTGSSKRVVFEVRDRFNNPISGTTVNATLSGPGTLATVDATTDADGHAVFRYETADAGTANVTATFGTAPGAARTATVTVSATGGGGASGDAVGPTVSNVDTNRTTASGEAVAQGETLRLTATASDFQRGGTDVYAVEWWSNRTDPGGSAGSGFALVPESGDDDEFDSVDEDVAATVDTGTWTVGTHTITLRARDAAGNWGPNATYEVVVTSGSTDPSGTVAYDDANGNGRYDSGEATYTKAELEDGFDDTSVDLVVPADVGTLDTDGNELKARSITLLTDIESRGDDITLTAERGIDITGQNLTTRGGDITIRAGESGRADLVATDATIETNKNVDLRSNGDMYLDGATVVARDGSDAKADLQRSSTTLFVDDLTVRDKDDTFTYQPSGVTVDGRPAEGSVDPA